jgi:hypothetical protein
MDFSQPLFARRQIFQIMGVIFQSGISEKRFQ